ncbi:hypothetical protein C5167_020493 [Papaver somniferum]|uniref:Uncharacterized protein n=1 Tax=Papaver somniferum TaxID=3469 RepID=A0A4Y7IT56_PAPSO|nr:hypothetical protein C5167_020493 [Papaver somniferum]
MFGGEKQYVVLQRICSPKIREAKELYFNKDRCVVNKLILLTSLQITLGPKVRNVVSEMKYDSPKIVKDGVVVAKEVDLEDSVENVSAKLAHYQGRTKKFDVEKALATSLHDFEKEIYGFLWTDNGTVPPFSIPESAIAKNPFTSLLLCSCLPFDILYLLLGLSYHFFNLPYPREEITERFELHGP